MGKKSTVLSVPIIETSRVGVTWPRKGNAREVTLDTLMRHLRTMK